MPKENTRDAGSQTEKPATTSPGMASPLADSGLFREPNYDFLKAPPSANSSMRSRKNSRTTQPEIQTRTVLAPRADNQLVLGPDATGFSDDHSKPTAVSMPPPRSMTSHSASHMDPSGTPLVSPPANEWSDSVFAVPSLPAPSMTRADMATPVSRQTSRVSMHARDDASLGGPTGSTSEYYSSSRSGPSQGSIRQSRDSVRQRADVVVPATPASRPTTQHRMASMSSARSSEYGLPPPPTESRQQAFTGPSGSTDPAVVQDLTKTMIGQFLWKDTRKAFGSGLSGNMHERFFWINPYTKTLYWSAVDPGGVHAAESSAKSGKLTV